MFQILLYVIYQTYICRAQICKNPANDMQKKKTSLDSQLLSLIRNLNFVYVNHPR